MLELFSKVIPRPPVSSVTTRDGDGNPVHLNGRRRRLIRGYVFEEWNLLAQVNRRSGLLKEVEVSSNEPEFIRVESTHPLNCRTPCWGLVRPHPYPSIHGVKESRDSFTKNSYQRVVLIRGQRVSSLTSCGVETNRIRRILVEGLLKKHGFRNNVSDETPFECDSVQSSV